MSIQSSAASYPERFADQMVRLRWRAGLSQRELADLLGLRERTIQRWEAGRGLPSAATLHALLTLYLERGAFVPGHEEAGVSALWNAVCNEHSRLRTPFDPAWLQTLPRVPVPMDLPTGHRDWGDAHHGQFYGRTEELATLAGWVHEQARLVAVLGSGGVGKTSLAARLARDVASTFDYLYWRSLRNAPPVEEWLAGAIGLLSEQRLVPPAGVEACLALLRDLLRARRTLLVLDNLETVLEPGVVSLRYREGYEGYGEVLQLVGERGHQATMLVTSREPPPEISPTSGPRFAWQVLRLRGLGLAESRALLQPRGLDGDEAAWQALVAHYRGNPLALRLVSETIAHTYLGNIAAFLAARATSPTLDRLLEGQLGRLSTLERSVLLWLAVCREPVSFAELARSLATEQRGAVLGAVEALRRRSLLETGGRGTVTLQPVVLEYATDQLVQAVSAEVERGQPALLRRHALVQATAKDYVRRSQERLIALPLLERLRSSSDSAAVERQLLALLAGWRGPGREEQGYGPGNVVNLLRLLRRDLRGLDLSRLSVRQAYLQESALHDASLAGARVTDCVLAAPIDHPLNVELDAEGTHLAVGTAGGEVWVWHIADRTPILTVVGQSGVHMDLALSADGKVLADGGADGMVRRWDLATGACLVMGQPHSGAVFSVALSADGRLLASGGADGLIKLWDTGSGEPRATLQGHTDAVFRARLSADGTLLASGSADGSVRVWQLETGATAILVQGPAGTSYHPVLSADGRLLAYIEQDGSISLWAARGRERLGTVLGHPTGTHCVAISADGLCVATGADDGTIGVWETSSGACLALLAGHTGMVWNVSLSGDSTLLASCGADATVRLWETGSGTCRTVLQGLRGGIFGIALSKDGALLATGGAEGTITLSELAGGKVQTSLHGHRGSFWRLALDGTGTLLASGGGDGQVQLWRTRTGECLARLPMHIGGIWGVSLSADGRLLAYGTGDGTVRLWDISSVTCLTSLPKHGGGTRGVSLSADGAVLATGCADGTVRLWDTRSAACLLTLPERYEGLWDVAVSGDGRLLAIGGLSETIELWDVGRGALLRTLSGHRGGVRGVAFSGDGRLLVSSGADEMARIWETDTGTCVRTLRPDRLYERLDITGLTGVTEAQRMALLALGAVEHNP